MAIIKEGSKRKPLTEWEAQEALRSLYNHHDLTVPNVHFCGTEMDFCCVTKSGCIWEIEIKLTLADWLRDRKKRKWNCDGCRLSEKVSRFFYAVPAELVKRVPDFVPATSGIIRLFERPGRLFARVAREAKQISRYKATEKDCRVLLESLYWRFWRQRYDLNRLRENYDQLSKHAGVRQSAWPSEAA